MRFVETNITIFLCLNWVFINAFDQCLMPNNRHGSCVPLNQCASLLKIVEKAKMTKAELEFLRRSRCGYIGISPFVCCPIRADSSASFRIDDEVPKNCGRTELKQDFLVERIVGGYTAHIYDSPWQALLRYERPSGVGFACGGVLINKDCVITAAHCVADSTLKKKYSKLLSIRLGEWNIDKKIDCEKNICSDPVWDVPINKIFIHENYQEQNLKNDIALVRLAYSVTFTQWIKPICLPVNMIWKKKSFDDLPMVVSGWGRTSSSLNALGSKIKLQVTIKGVSNARCNYKYRKHNLTFNESQMCAGGEKGFDSCQGDSGSPLTYYDESTNRWHVIGIVSFGHSECGTPDWPGVYTRVDSYIDWILSKLR